MKTHIGEKAHKCAQYDYSFIHGQKLENYMQTHTGEKPFVYDQCVYSCAQDLRLRKRKHTGEISFNCDQCNYSCALAGTLKVHKRKHTHEKPYECEQCDYSCAHASHLQRQTHWRTASQV